jgi:hypothetical protein
MKDQPKADVSPDPAGDAIKKWEALQDLRAKIVIQAEQIAECKRDLKEMDRKCVQAFQGAAALLNEFKTRIAALEARHKPVIIRPQ